MTRHAMHETTCKEAHGQRIGASLQAASQASSAHCALSLLHLLAGDSFLMAAARHAPCLPLFQLSGQGTVCALDNQGMIVWKPVKIIRSIQDQDERTSVHCTTPLHRSLAPLPCTAPLHRSLAPLPLHPSPCTPPLAALPLQHSPCTPPLHRSLARVTGQRVCRFCQAPASRQMGW